MEGGRIWSQVLQISNPAPSTPGRGASIFMYYTPTCHTMTYSRPFAQQSFLPCEFSTPLCSLQVFIILPSKISFGKKVNNPRGTMTPVYQLIFLITGLPGDRWIVSIWPLAGQHKVYSMLNESFNFFSVCKMLWKIEQYLKNRRKAVPSPYSNSRNEKQVSALLVCVSQLCLSSWVLNYTEHYFQSRK